MSRAELVTQVCSEGAKAAEELELVLLGLGLEEP